MSGAFDAVSDFGSSLVSSAADLGSAVTDFGTEFASSISDFTGFDLSLDSVADFGGFAEIGSFAGDASWFDTFNFGSITEFAGQVQSDFTGFINSAQSAYQAYQQYAPVVNLASSALGIQNPINELIQPVGQLVGIAGTAAGVAGTVSGVAGAADSGNIRSLITNPAVVTTATGILNTAGGGVVTTGIQAGVSAYNTAQSIVAAIPTQNPAAVASTGSSNVNDFISAYDPETSSWSVYDTINGTTVQTGLTEQQALLAEQDLGITDGITLNTSTTTTDDPFEQARLDRLLDLEANQPTSADVISATNGITVAQTDAARYQQSIRSLRNNKAQSSDWRVRLRLAPNSQYLYNATQPGILAALKLTDGVIFPYTPTVETAYKANYDTYDLTHSNYRGYFYKNSYVDAVNLRATFTAQDSKEADYLLAVIHFFRSCTKMFYGQDSQRGAPPPLVYLSGYGDYQFSEHPCLISQFNYSLPPDVDYIRAQNNLQSNTNQLNQRLRNPIANNPVAYTANRILNSGLFAGALATNPAMANNLDNSAPTYVPTKMEISITLLPVQSRSQVSNNFSVQGFANGNLLRDGYW